MGRDEAPPALLLPLAVRFTSPGGIVLPEHPPAAPDAPLGSFVAHKAAAVARAS